MNPSEWCATSLLRAGRTTPSFYPPAADSLYQPQFRPGSALARTPQARNQSSYGAGRMQGLMPPPDDAFAQAYMAKMQNYPTPYTTQQEAAEAVFSAATDDLDRLRYPVGEDTKLFSALRWTTSEEEYLAKMRKMFGPELQP